MIIRTKPLVAGLLSLIQISTAICEPSSREHRCRLNRFAGYKVVKVFNANRRGNQENELHSLSANSEAKTFQPNFERIKNELRGSKLVNLCRNALTQLKHV